LNSGRTCRPVLWVHDAFNSSEWCTDTYEWNDIINLLSPVGNINNMDTWTYYKDTNPVNSLHRNNIGPLSSTTSARHRPPISARHQFCKVDAISARCQSRYRADVGPISADIDPLLFLPLHWLLYVLNILLYPFRKFSITLFWPVIYIFLPVLPNKNKYMYMH
jgi:hypothetical protein